MMNLFVLQIWAEFAQLGYKFVLNLLCHFALNVYFGLVISPYLSFKLTTFRFSRFYSLILKVNRRSICGDLRVFDVFSYNWGSFGMVVSV